MVTSHLIPVGQGSWHDYSYVPNSSPPQSQEAITHLVRLSRRMGLLCGLALAAPCWAGAADVFSTGNVRLVLGGEASGSAALGDEGWFNQTDYSRSVVHLARFSLSAELRAGERVALLSEVRSENVETPQVYALFLRLRPWPLRSLDLQAGRIPPVFGAYPRRRYAADNPLIGEPLAYQYLTILRTDSLPRTADDLLSRRGEGWLVGYPVGSPYPAPGGPLVSATRWDTGVEVHVGSEPLEGGLALTQGTLCNPLTHDDNDGKQISGRVAAHPTLGLVLGFSVAQGEYLAREATSALPPTIQGPFRQSALGFDAEWSRGYWLLRAEAVWSHWDMPAIAAPYIRSPLRAAGAFLEGRYKLAPGLYVAARLDHLGMSEIQGSEMRATWDAPVSRVEAGVGVSPRRNLWLKAVYQHNWRDGGLVRSQGIGAAQISWWF
jgi:hypothetical protein